MTTKIVTTKNWAKVHTYPIKMMRKEARFTTRNMKTEYSQPATFSSLTWKGKHTPEGKKI